MAVIDNLTGWSSQPAYAGPRIAMWERVVDFSVDTMAQNDTMTLFTIPADMLVFFAKVDVITVEGGTATIDIGVTGGDVDRYIDGADINATTTVVAGDAGTPEPISMQNNGVYVSTAETVSILANNALDAAKIRVQIMALDCRSILPD